MGESARDVFTELAVNAEMQGFAMPLVEAPAPVAALPVAEQQHPATAATLFFEEVHGALERQGFSFPTAQAGGNLAVRNF